MDALFIRIRVPFFSFHSLLVILPSLRAPTIFTNNPARQDNKYHTRLQP
jgi:hypothetical protein